MTELDAASHREETQQQEIGTLLARVKKLEDELREVQDMRDAIPRRAWSDSSTSSVSVIHNKYEYTI